MIISSYLSLPMKDLFYLFEISHSFFKDRLPPYIVKDYLDFGSGISLTTEDVKILDICFDISYNDDPAVFVRWIQVGDISSHYERYYYSSVVYPDLFDQYFSYISNISESSLLSSKI